jgi:hypothetical protein
MNSGGNPSQVGSEAHYAAYEAEYQMRSQMESMQADIQEKVALGMAAKVEAALDAQIKAADDDMDSIEVLRKKRIQQMAKDAKLKRVPLPFAWKHFTYVLLVGIGSYRTYEVHRDFRRKGIL